MSEDEDWSHYLRRMEGACQRIVDYTSTMSFEDFVQDGRTYDAVIRNLEIIQRVDESFPDDARIVLDDRYWNQLRRLGDVLSETGHRDKQAEAWDLARDEIPAVLNALQAAKDNVDIIPAPEEADDPRGRLAERPRQIPRRGWRDVLLRVWDQLFDDNLFIVSAGVAFFALLSVFPALSALVSIYGLWFDPANVNDQLQAIAGILPGDSQELIREQLARIASQPDVTLSLSAIGSLVFALWSARAGIGVTMTALNIVYDEREKRSILRFYAVSLVLTIGAIIFIALALGLVVAFPALVNLLGLRGSEQLWGQLVRWPMLAITTMVGLAIVYRYGPSRRPAKWRWVSWGAAAATALWLLGSALLSFYIANFGRYNEVYGSVGAVVVLMLWFFVTAFIVLLGAEFNAETEHQTSRDSTKSPPRPMGERGAYVADTLGRQP